MSFPTTLDTFVNPTGTDPLSSSGGVSHSSLHGLINTAVMAIEVKVGIDGSLVTTSHEYRINKLETRALEVTNTLDNSLQDVKVGGVTSALSIATGQVAVGGTGFTVAIESGTTITIDQNAILFQDFQSFSAALRTTDPHVIGEWWCDPADNHTIKISQGP